MTILKSKVQQDAITDRISSASDFAWTGENSFTVPSFDMPKKFGIGLIVGPSGSGKSSILKTLGLQEEEYIWDPNKAVASHFKSYDEASEKLSAVALNSIPDQLKPYQTLSTGQKFRAQMAMALKDNAVVDEFTSVIDRNVAKALSNSIRKYVDRKDLKNIVLVGCHYDVIEWLRPDWIFDTKTGTLSTERSLRRPKITLDIRKADKGSWSLFKQHHYLTADLPNNTPHAYLYYWNDQLVGYGSLNAFPHPKLKNCYNIGRVVVLPDFQGLGVGYPIFKNLAQIATHNFNHTTGGYGRVKVVTAIPALHNKMNNDVDWQFIKGSDVRKVQKPTDRKFGGYDDDYYKKHQKRITKAFHYVGPKGFELDNPNLVCDNILETKSWRDNKNMAQNKLTGNIIKDFRPPIAGETDYQFIMEGPPYTNMYPTKEQ
jgi:ABC-type ATPase involved in cell division/GNAT superfamily N-acetyltransferase